MDIWRISNPTERRFTWRQQSPIIQRRLDFWLVSDTLQEDVESVEIIPWIKFDHSAITLALNGIDDSKGGPSFWKFNSTLVNDNEYCQLLDGNFKIWQEEYKEIIDKRVLWDLLKYKIRFFTINYSKIKAQSRRANVIEVEGNLRHCKEKCDAEPSIQNVEELERIQANYDELYDYITQGAIIRVPTLSEELRSICEGKITYNECFSVLQSFQKNKTPGNDGLTVEFYSALWPLIGKYLVDCINYVYEFGELSNTQKQAIITLIEKRGKDKRLI